MPIQVTNAAPLDRFVKDSHNGHNLIFVNSRIEEGDFGFGDTQTAVADVICFNCKQAWQNQRVFGQFIVGRLAQSDGKIVAGALVQGEAKAGRSAPWMLDDLNDDELTDIQAYLERVVDQLRSGKLVVNFDLINNLEEV
jgi:hypothetical protein